MTFARADENAEKIGVQSTQTQEGLRLASSVGQGFDPASSVGHCGAHTRQAEDVHSLRSKLSREADVVVVPTLPTSALEVQRWAMDVTAAVQAASGRQEIVSLRLWLEDARTDGVDPDVYFDATRTPVDFVS